MRPVLRLLVPAVSGLLALSATVPVARAGDEPLTAHLDRSRTMTGQDVEVTGRAAPGTHLRLQELDGTRWVTRWRSDADGTGRYRLRVAAYAVGDFTYRVVGDGATSPSLDLQVRGRGHARTWQTRYDHLYRWDPCQVLTYRVNARLAPRSWRHDVTGAVRRVARQSGLRLRYLGPTRVVPQRGTTNPDGVDLVIAYTRPGQTDYLKDSPTSSILAVSDTTRLLVPTVDGQQRALANGRIVVDVGEQPYMPPGFGPGIRHDGYSMGTRGRLLMHEIGHVVGLGHVAQWGRSQHRQVMYPFMLGRVAAWGNGDAAGFAEVGADAGCFADPAPDARARTVVVRRSSPIA